MVYRSSKCLTIAAAAIFVALAPGVATAGPVPAGQQALSRAVDTALIEQVQTRRVPPGVRTAAGIGLAVGVLGALAAGAAASSTRPPPVFEDEPIYGHPREPVYMRRRVVEEPVYAPRPVEQPVYYRSGGVGDPADYCARQYRSYDRATGTYIDYSGRVRRCPS